MWAREDFISEAARDAGEAGFTLSDLSNAVQTWSFMQARRTNVEEAAAAFNTSPALICEAVRAHHWMFLESRGGALVDEFDDATGRYSTPAAIDDFEDVYIGHEGE